MSKDKFLDELPAKYAKQDNRMTAYPTIVLIQTLRPVGVIADGYSVVGDGETREEPNVECDDCQYYETCECENHGDYGCKAEKVQMGYVWMTVEVCFTLEAAEDYIKRDGHNYGKLRTWVDHINVRNCELREVCRVLGLKTTG
jgi:hypothetical protein